MNKRSRDNLYLPVPKACYGVKRYPRRWLDIWFFRDSNHNEVDVVAENEVLQWMEIKSARTFSPDFITTFRFLDKNEDAGKDNRSIIYGGDDTFLYKGFKIVSWRGLRKFETLEKIRK